MSAPYLSVVIPAYNEGKRLPPTLRRVIEFLKTRPEPYEIIVIDDGSRDDTIARATELGADNLVVSPNEGNRGKGYSVRRGMLLARGEYRLMTDADLSTPIEEVDRLLEVARQGHDVVIASRAIEGAKVEVRQPWFRENSGRVFNLCMRMLTGLPLKDTQCGFKLFSARAADASFGPARMDGFSFDVEALFIARQLGFRIAEVPVTWRNDEASRVSLMSGLTGFTDLLRIRRNAWAGYYRARTGSGSGPL
jgi:dolichyl-phosphate beta-glucosyltransferase